MKSKAAQALAKLRAKSLSPGRWEEYLNGTCGPNGGAIKGVK